jgi:gallate dioxygenase
MARIIGAIATSHTPTIGFALDANKQADPVWKPIFDAYEPIKAWLKEKQPDALFIIYNDHVSSFFFDHYSAFALGVGEEYPVADEGGGPRGLPPIKGHSPLARHIGESLVADEFDMSFFQGKPLDHGCFSPMSVLLDRNPDWPMPIIPLQMGVLQFPVPSATRCWKFGQALRNAIESYPEDLKVCIVATGGLSHQVHGERCGFNNPPWDQKFMDLLENDPIALTRMTHADHATLGGAESAEIVMWLLMRGALAANAKVVHKSHYLPSMTAIATMIFEHDAEPMPAKVAEAHRAHMYHQVDGIEKLDGTHPFTLERSVKNYRLNKYLRDLVIPEHRALFKSDQEKSFEQAGLPENERDMIRRLDWLALIRHGAIFFVLEKLAAVSAVPNPAVYAAFRGMTLDEFQKTRNAAVTYGVGGKETQDKVEASGKR